MPVCRPSSICRWRSWPPWSAGGIWGFIPGILKAKTGAHEVITTIMLNYIAYRISTVVIGQEDFPLVNPALQATQPAVDAARLPKLIEGTRLHAGFLIALVAAVVVWFLLYRTVFGYQIRTVGLSRGASAYAGISWGKTIALAMLLSGLLSGLGGAVDALGLQGRYYNVSLGLGFTSIAVGSGGTQSARLASCFPVSSLARSTPGRPRCKTPPA